MHFPSSIFLFWLLSPAAVELRAKESDDLRWRRRWAVEGRDKYLDGSIAGKAWGGKGKLQAMLEKLIKLNTTSGMHHTMVRFLNA
ncbi:unnamed protein product [Linum tenue]|uniref:Uncharacterized protein n=1 Tax=Linum tenue TaxID=586396 RepID=A0AAV0I1J5_9ROSI|nr:unnamed protein product [Linum tenue]